MAVNGGRESSRFERKALILAQERCGKVRRLVRAPDSRVEVARARTLGESDGFEAQGNRAEKVRGRLLE